VTPRSQPIGEALGVSGRAQRRDPGQVESLLADELEDERFASHATIIRRRIPAHNAEGHRREPSLAHLGAANDPGR
jgi:hypothetical protein